MDALTKIDNTIEAAKKKRKQVLVDSFKGRTQKYIGEQTQIDEIKLSRWVNGFGTLSDAEISRLETFLGVDLK